MNDKIDNISLLLQFHLNRIIQHAVEKFSFLNYEFLHILLVENLSNYRKMNKMLTKLLKRTL